MERWKQPHSPEGRVWLGEFNRRFMRWVAEPQAGDGLVLSAAAALRNWLNRVPQDAATVQAVALGGAFNARLRARPDAVTAFARVGMDADLLVEGQDAARASMRVLFNLYIAEADLKRGRRFEGLDALDLAADLRRQASPADAVAEFFDGYACFLRGALCELGVDFDRAAAAYAMGAEKLEPLLGAGDKLVAAAHSLLDLCAVAWRQASSQDAQALARIVEEQIRVIAALNALGRMRASWMSAEREELARLSASTWDVVRRAGLPAAAQAGALDFFPLVLALAEPQARSCATDVVGVVERPGAAHWRAVLCSAWLAQGDNRNAPAAAWWRKELESALPQVGDTLVRAFVDGRLLLAAPRDARALRRFLASLNAVVQLESFDDVRVRALFDEPIAVCLEAALRELEHNPAAAQRVRVAALLDALRGEKPGALALDPQGAPRAGVQSDLLCALNRLDRIGCALRARPGAAAIVLQVAAGGYAFICIGGGRSAGVRISRGGAECVRACRDLVEHLENQMAAAQMTGYAPGGSGIRPAGLAAFRALPTAVREHIARARTLLVVPDPRSPRDAVPFELLHDGKGFLGPSRVVARFSSLRALTRAVERLARRAPERTAFVAAASRVAGWAPLPRAQREVRSVRAALSKARWNVPPIGEERLTGEFFRKLFARASLLHVAAHGSVEPDHGDPAGPGEAIVLPGEARFTTDDLLRRRFPRVPLSYINCCSLGTTRYLAGGISRGIAHTLVEAGAPAAIANLLPVDDAVASDVALEFYAQLARHPVGEALRRARKALALKGANPLLWGSTVLTGDPWTTLEPKAPRRPLSEELLNAYFTPGIGRRRRDALRARAERAALAGAGDPRLKAATGLLRVAGGVHDLATSEARQRWNDVIRMADEVDHLPASAMVRLANLLARAKELAPEQTVRLAEDALPYLEALSATDPEAWDDLARTARAAKREAESRARTMLDAMHLENPSLTANY